MSRLAVRAKVIARALDTRAVTSRVNSTRDTARLERGPTRPRVRPMKLRRRMRSMPDPAPSSPTSAIASALPADGATSDTGNPSAVPGPDKSDGSPGPATSGPLIPPSLRERSRPADSRGGPNRGPTSSGGSDAALRLSIGEHGGDLVAHGNELGHHEVASQPVGAVDHERVARDERGVGRAQPRRGPAQLVQTPQPTRGGTPGVHVLALGAKRLQVF